MILTRTTAYAEPDGVWTWMRRSGEPALASYRANLHIRLRPDLPLKDAYILATSNAAKRHSSLKPFAGEFHRFPS